MTPWIVACQALLAMVFPRQEYWHGLPFPSPGDLPDIGIEPSSPELPGGFFTAEALGKNLLQVSTIEAPFFFWELRWVLFRIAKLISMRPRAQAEFF